MAFNCEASNTSGSKVAEERSTTSTIEASKPAARARAVSVTVDVFRTLVLRQVLALDLLLRFRRLVAEIANLLHAGVKLAQPDLRWIALRSNFVGCAFQKRRLFGEFFSLLRLKLTELIPPIGIDVAHHVIEMHSAIQHGLRRHIVLLLNRLDIVHF